MRAGNGFEQWCNQWKDDAEQKRPPKSINTESFYKLARKQDDKSVDHQKKQSQGKHCDWDSEQYKDRFQKGIEQGNYNGNKDSRCIIIDWYARKQVSAK